MVWSRHAYLLGRPRRAAFKDSTCCLNHLIQLLASDFSLNASCEDSSAITKCVQVNLSHTICAERCGTSRHVVMQFLR